MSDLITVLDAYQVFIIPAFIALVLTAIIEA